MLKVETNLHVTERSNCILLSQHLMEKICVNVNCWLQLSFDYVVAKPHGVCIQYASGVRSDKVEKTPARPEAAVVLWINR